MIMSQNTYFVLLSRRYYYYYTRCSKSSSSSSSSKNNPYCGLVNLLKQQKRGIVVQSSSSQQQQQQQQRRRLIQQQQQMKLVHHQSLSTRSSYVIRRCFITTSSSNPSSYYDYSNSSFSPRCLLLKQQQQQCRWQQQQQQSKQQQQQHRYQSSYAVRSSDAEDVDNNNNNNNNNNTNNNNDDSIVESTLFFDEHHKIGGPLYEKYYQMVEEAGVYADPHQLKALESLERLRNDLMNIPPPPKKQILVPQTQPSSQTTSSSSSGGWGGWFSSSSSTSSMMNTLSSSFSSKNNETQIHGVYLHGGVGCGKTFLMNQIFFDSLNGTLWDHEKQKTHFHKFMLNIHQEMHIARKNIQQQQHSGKQHVSDAILPAVIQKTVEKGRLICFDEFQVTDVADALILQRLFTGLWDAGCIVVATSNRPPVDLYKDGLQRDRFLPFIDAIQQKCTVVSMWESETDYRLVQKAATSPGSVGTSSKVYYTASDHPGIVHPNKMAKAAFDTLFYDFIGTAAVTPTFLTTQGRKVHIPQAAVAVGIARFTFEDLCQKALGAADYLLIGQTFHTVFVENIPVLTLAELNWVRRFIIFIDAMYESNVKLILHAKTPANLIFQPTGEVIDTVKTKLPDPPPVLKKPTQQHILSTIQRSSSTSTTSTDHKNNNKNGTIDEIQNTIDEVFAFDRTVSRLEEMSSISYLQKQHKRWCGGSQTDITKPKMKDDSCKSRQVVEPKAALLSKKRAVVNVTPS